MIAEKFFHSKTAIVTLFAACFVVLISLGVRQVFGLLFIDFNESLNISNTAFGFAIGVQMLMWGLTGPIFGAIADRYGGHIAIISAFIFYTVGIFNIMYMDDILQYDKEHNLDCEIHYNMVYAPEHVSPKALPPKVKRYITDKFKDNNDHRIQSTLNYMNGEQYDVKEMIPQLVRQTKFSDEYRGESFAKTFPELYKFLQGWFEAPQTGVLEDMKIIGLGDVNG